MGNKKKKSMTTGEQQNLPMIKKRKCQDSSEISQIYNNGSIVTHKLSSPQYINESVNVNSSSATYKKIPMTSTERSQVFRAKQTAKAREQEKIQNRIRVAEIWAAMTVENRDNVLEKNRTRKVAKRAAEEDNERVQRIQHVRQQREWRQSQATYKIATKTLDILQGNHYVPKLSETEDSIGNMDHPCIYCGALKYKNEAYTLCCGKGKVDLPPFPKPPQEIYDLFFDDTPKAKLFRANCRSINNAVCLSSLAVQDKNKNARGFSPSVIFQGRVVHRMGPIQADAGVQPCFAQLYVLDPSQETTTRFSNMNLPVGMKPNEKEVMKELLKTVQKAVHQFNPFVHGMKQVLEIPSEDLENGKVVISAKVRPQDAHARVYNAQTNLQELTIVTKEKPHDLVIHLRGGGLQIISDLNPKAMPLHFTLLFIYGTYGWHTDLLHKPNKEDTSNDIRKRVTAREFYAFHFNVRNTDSDYIFRGGRLLQELALNGWITCDNQKVNYLRFNQAAIRSDSYQNVKDIVNKRKQEQGQDSTDNIEQANGVGRVILPSSFVGGVRWFNSKYQDAMAIVRNYTKPTLFITMTCNPGWSEIKSSLAPDQTPQDRPDLVARVFKLKKDQLMNDLIKGKILGKVVAHLWVVEFQKRGLPHVHILIILASEDRPKTADQVDQIVCAELPPDPSEENISQEEKAKRQPLWDIVLTNMIHGPCEGDFNNVCMEKRAGKDGKLCSKNFPKSFQKKTSVDEKKSYPLYRRRSPHDGGQTAKKKNKNIDNSWVVPYNPYLSLRYNCHINVEICISSRAAKYLYKYVTKGSDRAMVFAEVESEDCKKARDEIREYEDMRSIGSSEALWHIYSFPISENKPPVQVLRLHLENKQHVFFVGGNEENVIDQGRETELTAFFKINASEKLAKGPDFDPSTMPRYIDFPKKYAYREKKWHLRQRGISIGRVHTVNPLAGDVFYLRILLHHDHCRGKISFIDLMTINGRLCDSYQEVCRELGLLRDDQEWSSVLALAATTKFCQLIRALYIIILMFCQPADPKKLFEDFWADWTDDFKRDLELRGQQFSEKQLKTMVRMDIQVRLLSHEKDLPDFGLDPMTDEEKATVSGLVNTEEPLICDEKVYNVNELLSEVEKICQMFTATQKSIYDTIMAAVMQKKGLQIFISACGGGGKTFLLNGVLKAVRSLEPNGCVALAMGTTGIAAQLLDLGRTFHSRMKAPLKPDDKSTLNITAQSSLARLVRMAKLLLIDEATMLHRYNLEALDRTLRDLTENPDDPFGGKIIILAGDFRQCLTVIQRANRAQIVEMCINKSHLWRHFQVHMLTENMRVKASGDPILEAFDKWTLGLGEGTVNDENGRVIIPEDMITIIKPNTIKDNKVEERCMEIFCRKVFPNLETNILDPKWLEGRAILAPTNKEVDTINDMMETWVPGESTKLSSADTFENKQDEMRFNTEYLNTLSPNGFPKHIIALKPGMPLMLLRNINPKEGLCNGTKLIYLRTLNLRLLVCKLAGSGKEVLIPRIKFTSDSGSFSFDWARIQFPVRVAFSTTINKSQGQTLKEVGVWLRSPVFSHGQFYVACSRVGNPASLRIAIMQPPGKQVAQTDNVIFREVLLTS